MVFLRAGLIVSMMFIFLVVAPVSVVGGRTGLLHEVIEVPGVSENLMRETDSSVGLGSPGHIDPGFSGRKMLAAEGSAHEAPTEQLDGHASTVSSTAVPSAETQSTPRTPAAPARFATRFAFLFRSLAKGSSPPSTGTPSPGHN